MYRASAFLLGAFVPVAAIGAYAALDFYNVNNMARTGDGDGVSVGEYISGIVPAVGAWLDPAPAAPQMPTELADMLPKAPEGWTMRPTEPADIDAFLPASAPDSAPDSAGEKLAAYVRAVVNPRGGNGTREVRMTYENGPRRVVFELVRYPNFIFTSFGAMQIKMELEMISSRYNGQNFMTVRGMDFTEDVLPQEVGLRYFFGHVSSQTWVRVLAPRSMTDQDLLPFFQTLHVPAINADVVEKVAGMGDVPVIVLASALDEESRAARAAAQATEETERAAKHAAALAAQAAEQARLQQEADDRANGIERDEDSGVTLRKGTGAGATQEKTKTGLGDGSCQMVGTRKVCSGSDGQGD